MHPCFVALRDHGTTPWACVWVLPLQVRFELTFYALQPNIKVLAPWRERPFFERFKVRIVVVQ